MQTAEAWFYQSCIEACEAALLAQNLYAQICTFSELKSPFDTFFFQAIKQRAEQHLLSQMLDTPKVLSRPSTLQLLTEQPHAFMLALLKDIRLCTDAEATVLVLVQAWYENNKQTCSDSDLEDLKQEIRYGGLHAFYLLEALPLMAKLGVTREQERELSTLQSAVSGVIPSNERKLYHPHCPSSWFVPRCKPARFSPIIKLQLRVTRKELMLHVAAVAAMPLGGPAPSRIVSKSKPSHGYDWSLFFTSDTTASAFSVGVQLKLPFADAVSVTQECSILINAVRRWDEDGPDVIAEQVKGWICNEASWHDCFSTKDEVLKGETSLKPWREFLGKGDLCMEAFIECTNVEDHVRIRAGKNSGSDDEEEGTEVLPLDERYQEEGGVHEDDGNGEYSDDEDADGV